MAFKPVRNNTGEEIIELKVKDSYGTEISKWTIMISDFDKLVHLIRRQFGLYKKEVYDRDLDWAK